MQAERDAAQQAHVALQGELVAERQAHAATQARQEERVRQVAILDRQLLELHTQFSADLERTREQVMVAPERASATERRALREIDQERTLRQKAEQAVADPRAELAGMQARAQDAAVAAAEARAGREQGRIRADKGGPRGRNGIETSPGSRPKAA